MKKRFWACFLSLNLLLTMMPTMAFAADDEVNEPEGTVEVCVETEGCTLEAGHKGECVVVEPEPEESENVPCKVTEGCTLKNGHEGECVVAESEPEEPESTPCKVTEGCTLEDGHEGDCVVAGSEIKHEVKQQIETIVEAENTPLRFLQMKGDIFVKTEQELRDAISNASQDPQNPTIIWVEDDITLTQSLTIGSDRFVELHGNDYSISRDDSYTTDVATSLLVVQGSLITHDVILDAKCTEDINGFRVVQVDGNFTIYDTVIQNGYLNGGGANVLIASPDACFTMYSGRICNGHGANSGGVFVYGGGSGGTFYMYGGEISNNTGTHYGSAVVVYNTESKAYLYDGKIIDNVADRSAEGTDSNWGGAIFINGKDTTYIGGTLEMSGNYAQYAPNGEKEISYFNIFCTAGSNAGTNYPNFISELKNPLKIKYAYFYQNDCTAAIGAKGYTLTTNDLDLLELVDVAGLLYYDADEAEIRGTSQIDAVTLNDNYSDISKTLYVREGQDIILPEDPFTRTGYKFTGWNTQPDGTGDPVPNGAELDNDCFSDGLTLYAQWEIYIAENGLSGYCGATNEDEVYWALAPNGETVTIDNVQENAYTLTISGVGKMMDYEWSNENSAINAGWGTYRKKITKVIVEAGVTYTGAAAFRSFTYLNEIYLPDTLTEIGANMVYYSSSGAPNGLALKNIPSDLQKIGQSAFANSALTGTITLPSSVTEIGTQAFYNTDVTNISVHSTELTLGNNPFGSNNTNLTVLDLSSVEDLTLDTTGSYIAQTCGNAVLYINNQDVLEKIDSDQKTSVHIKAIAVTNGGTFPVDTVFQSGKLTDPTQVGYVFDGWYTDPDWQEEASANSPLSGVYYAGWIKCDDQLDNYTASGNVITATCDCGEHSATATLTAPSNLVYDGAPKTAIVDTTANWEDTVPTVTYKSGETSLTGAPTDVGTYTASITIDDVAATVKFTIEKAEPDLSITPSRTELSGGGNVILSIVGVPDEGKVSVTCKNENNENIEVTKNDDGTYSVTLPNETAKYTFTATYEGDHNHEAAQDTCTVSVTRHTGGGGASHPEASDDSSSDRNDRDDDDTENIDEEDVPLTEGKVADFDDVPADAWFAEAVQYVYEHDLMTGVSENLFAPNAQMNRAMVAQILFNMEQPTDTEAPAAFRDVAADQWYAKAVNWAVWQSYMSGYDASSFGPNDALTREQLVTVLWRYSGSPVMDNSSMLNTFSDAALTSDYAQQAMIWAYAQGVISGNADGTLNPQGTATRAEIAQMLMNYCENVK